MANEKQIIEVRSTVNDNVVVRFEHEHDESVNIFTAGYNRICDMLKINRVQAENRYYVAKG